MTLELVRQLLAFKYRGAISVENLTVKKNCGTFELGMPLVRACQSQTSVVDAEFIDMKGDKQQLGWFSFKVDTDPDDFNLDTTVSSYINNQLDKAGKPNLAFSYALKRQVTLLNMSDVSTITYLNDNLNNFDVFQIHESQTGKEVKRNSNFENDVSFFKELWNHCNQLNIDGWYHGDMKRVDGNPHQREMAICSQNLLPIVYSRKSIEPQYPTTP